MEHEFGYELNNRSNNSTHAANQRCLSYDMTRDGKSDCSSSTDEIFLIENCTHSYLVLCLDQCLPKKFKCNKEIDCIDGIDEVEGCGHFFRFFRHFKSDYSFLHSWSTMLTKFTDYEFFKLIVSMMIS